jgi:hypothetical protein
MPVKLPPVIAGTSGLDNLYKELRTPFGKAIGLATNK